jgi:hypothetical protein
MRLQRVEAVSPIVAYGGGEDRCRAQQKWENRCMK